MFIETFCYCVLTTMTLMGFGILSFCFYTCCSSYNKKLKEQEHAAILQSATRRKLSIRPDMQTSPIKRPIISPCKLRKSATFTKISTVNE